MIGSCGCERWTGGRRIGHRIEDLCLADDAVLIIAANDENFAVLQQSRRMPAARAIELARTDDLRSAGGHIKNAHQKDADRSNEPNPTKMAATRPFSR